MDFIKKRAGNGWFWAGVISIIILTVTYICNLCGVTFDVGGLNNYLQALLLALASIGVVTDPTTKGISDSAISSSVQKSTETKGE